MVAELNQKIVSSESIGTAANDLRDQRNEILKKDLRTDRGEFF